MTLDVTKSAYIPFSLTLYILKFNYFRCLGIWLNFGLIKAESAHEGSYEFKRVGTVSTYSEEQ